jgi:hypothetical protein
MPIPFRRDLERALAEFVESHKGLRMGWAFGLPAAFAGRRMFACVVEDGLACRLPTDAARRELRAGAKPFSLIIQGTRQGFAKTRARSGWVYYRPARGVLNRQISMALEEGARLAAALSLSGSTPTPRPWSSRPSRTLALTAVTPRSNRRNRQV